MFARFLIGVLEYVLYLLAEFILIVIKSECLKYFYILASNLSRFGWSFKYEKISVN